MRDEMKIGRDPESWEEREESANAVLQEEEGL
jgi:hypothetical protein